MSTRIVNVTTVTADTNYIDIEISQSPLQDMRFTIQCIWGAISGTKDCTLHLEGTLDGTNYDVLGDAVIMTADNSSTTFNINHYDMNKYRIVYTENTATSLSTLAIYTSLPAPTYCKAV